MISVYLIKVKSAPPDTGTSVAKETDAITMDMKVSETIIFAKTNN